MEMTEKIDLNEMKQQANKLLTQDGLMELLMGAMLFISSASFSSTTSYTPFLGMYVIFLNRILEGFRKRFTYPRIGYIKLPDDDSKEIGYGILTFVGTVGILLVVGVYITYGSLSGENIYRWIPMLVGMILFGGLHYNYSRTGDKTNYLYLSMVLLGGLAFSIKDFAEAKLGLQLYLLFIGGLFIVAGVVRFIVFTKKYPIKMVPDNE